MKRPLLLLLAFVILPSVMIGYLVATSYLANSNWWTELAAFGMPAVLISALILPLFALLVRPGWHYLLLPAIALFVALKPFSETFRFHRPAPDAPHDLSVMSFNAALFNPLRPVTHESDPRRFGPFYDHLRNSPAPDILCIQEFYHNSEAYSEQTVDSILHLGDYKYFYTNPQFDKYYDGIIGVITFSKYPAVASGKLSFGKDKVNNGHWIDVAIKGDTIRIFNFQLRSMGIRWTSFDKSSRMRNLVANLYNIHDRLRRGYRFREQEMAQIEVYLDAAPHRAIVCADINALPYSGTYQQLKKRYHNAFEGAGTGFGFTYHHFPWFIRIDNQFHDQDIGIVHFGTVTEISISDHYPILGHYAVH